MAIYTAAELQAMQAQGDSYRTKLNLFMDAAAVAAINGANNVAIAPGGDANLKVWLRAQFIAQGLTVNADCTNISWPED